MLLPSLPTPTLSESWLRLQAAVKVTLTTRWVVLTLNTHMIIFVMSIVICCITYVSYITHNQVSSIDTYSPCAGWCVSEVTVLHRNLTVIIAWTCASLSITDIHVWHQIFDIGNRVVWPYWGIKLQCYRKAVKIVLQNKWLDWRPFQACCCLERLRSRNMSYQRRAGKRSGLAFHWYAEGSRCFGGTGRG